MGEGSDFATNREDARPRPGGILLGGLVVAACGFVGATIGIFVAMPTMVRHIGPPLSWLLGVIIGGASGGGIGLYLALRLSHRGGRRGA